MQEKKQKSPWAWIPTLYFAEGLPYVAVMTIAVIMYKRMGISNTDIALYTSWLYLPWVIKPFWSPFVDLLKTKRWWIVIMQLLIGNWMCYRRYCDFAVVTPRRAECDHIRHKATISATIVHSASITHPPVAHQVSRERLCYDSPRRLQR